MGSCLLSLPQSFSRFKGLELDESKELDRKIKYKRFDTIDDKGLLAASCNIAIAAALKFIVQSYIDFQRHLHLEVGNN